MGGVHTGVATVGACGKEEASPHRSGGHGCGAHGLFLRVVRARARGKRE